ncbi:MAG: pyridoxal phosphate-dependent aminotransferase family protein [Actinomycetota bacterium]|nr:pyridoxal phosphate-dependent aminotransferase family protein [Actinomycetota bacterium]
MTDQEALHRPVADVFAKVDDPRVAQWHLAESFGMLPFFRELRGEVGPRMIFEGRPVVMLGSNNYLGLTADPRVRQAAVDAVGRYGTGLTGSRLLNGSLPLHRELEEELADWVGLESALVFTTGYAANLGLMVSLLGEGDAAFVDSAAHASLVDGGRFSEGTLRAFRHNRPNSLRRGLRAWREQPGAGGLLVAVDGVYSMEGDVAPLAEISAACTEMSARLLVDEAHALGVVGEDGSGSAREAGIHPDLVMGTFSKSLASCGGFIAGPRAVVEFLKVTCRPLLFTASGVPASLAAALEASRLARKETWRREAVVANARRLRSGLRQLGYDPGGDDRSAIVPIPVGDDWKAGTLWRALLDQGVYTNCAVAPAVSKALLRTSVMATHTEADIDDALAGFELAAANL